MALEIRYDADGCEGVLERVEESGAPEVRTLVTWVALCIGVIVVGTLLFERPTLTIPLAGVVAVVGLQLTRSGALDLFGWSFATTTVRERFHVKRGVLTVSTAEETWQAPLAGARITAFPDGVWVNPALGTPIRLTWDGATRDDVAKLVEALQSVADGPMQARGTSRDVPKELRKLTE